MSNDSSNKKKPDLGGTFKVKLKKPVDEHKSSGDLYLDTLRANPVGCVIHWLPQGDLEFSGDEQNPSTWTVVKPAKIEGRYLAGDTSTRRDEFFRAHASSESQDDKWSLSEGKLAYTSNGETRYLCDDVWAYNNDSGNLNLVKDQRAAATIEIVRQGQDGG